jgi:cytochrome d ubiquinol oxidase subunit I
VVVGVSGLVSGILVVAANAWMNSPAGFDFKDGIYSNIDPVKAMFNDAWFSQALHMCLAAFAATGFAVAGIHALMIVKKKNIDFHLTSFRIAAVFACVAAILQPVSGIIRRGCSSSSAHKLAAMEGLFKTGKNAPLLIGGIPDPQSQEVKYGMEIPGLLSFMVGGNTNTEIKGLDHWAAEDQPPVVITHIAFQLMVALGMFMFGVSSLYFYILARKRNLIDTGWC